jgi:Rhodopirellula transposase DDE domain
VTALQAAGQPVISVGTKKKELVGEYKNGGSDYRATGCPDTVKVHDSVDPALGKVAPYGIYDIAANAGRVSVGIDHDTAAFAVNALRRWYDVIGRDRYQTAKQPADHRRWRWLERIAGAIMEARIAEAG